MRRHAYLPFEHGRPGARGVWWQRRRRWQSGHRWHRRNRRRDRHEQHDQHVEQHDQHVEQLVHVEHLLHVGHVELLGQRHRLSGPLSGGRGAVLAGGAELFGAARVLRRQRHLHQRLLDVPREPLRASVRSALRPGRLHVLGRDGLRRPHRRDHPVLLRGGPVRRRAPRVLVRGSALHELGDGLQQHPGGVQGALRLSRAARRSLARVPERFPAPTGPTTDLPWSRLPADHPLPGETPSSHRTRSHCLPADPRCLPVDPRCLPADPHCLPADPRCLPVDPRCLPADPRCLPADLTGPPGDLQGLPASAHHRPGSIAGPRSVTRSPASAAIRGGWGGRPPRDGRAP